MNRLSSPSITHRAIACSIVTCFLGVYAFAQVPPVTKQPAGASQKAKQAVSATKSPPGTTSGQLPPSATSGLVLTQPAQTYQMSLKAIPQSAPPGYPIRFDIENNFPTGNQSIRFVLDYGDGTKEPLPINNPTTTGSHTFTATGTYNVVARLARVSENVAMAYAYAVQYGDSTTVTIDSISLGAAPDNPAVHQDVTVSVLVPENVRDLMFRFHFGDGTPPSVWNRSTAEPHAYSNEGRFFAYADIGRPMDGTVVPFTRTRAKEILVGPPVPHVTERLFLRANKTQVEIDEPVEFNATLVPAVPGAKFRFLFGDRESSPWQISNVLSHQYRGLREFKAYVEATFADVTLRSDPLVIRVVPPGTPPPDGSGGIPPLVWIVAGVAVAAAASLGIRRWRKGKEDKKGKGPPTATIDVRPDTAAPRLKSAKQPRIAVRGVLRANLGKGRATARTKENALVKSVRRKHA